MMMFKCGCMFYIKGIIQILYWFPQTLYESLFKLVPAGLMSLVLMCLVTERVEQSLNMWKCK